MDIEKIAKKLEPLAPDEVEHWRRTRELVDSDMQSLLDKQIISLAHQRLGGFHKKPLLSLPPENKSKGVFHLGKVLYENEKWDFGLSKNELLQHLAIFGRSGSGKTNLTFDTTSDFPVSISIPIRSPSLIAKTSTLPPTRGVSI